jgi:hypothetical protein
MAVLTKSWLLLCGAALLWAAAGTHVEGGTRVVLENVDRYRVMEACDECVRVVLACRGETYTPAYVQGIAGTAFKIAGPCPCAPTCGDAMPPDKLLRLLGYEVECVPLTTAKTEADLKADGARLVERIKAEIRAGRPVIVWNAFTTAEWDVVAGYDESDQTFLGRGSYAGLDGYASAPQMRLTACEGIPCLGAIFVGKQVGRYNARAAEVATLRYAIRHARSAKFPMPPEAGQAPVKWGFREGLNCYRWWAHRFRTEPGKTPDAGDRYPLGIYRSTHRAAGEFMLELAAKWPEAGVPFGRAADRFAREADCLDRLFDGLMGGWSGWTEPDPDKSRQAADLLDRAAHYYGQAIREVESGLGALGH